jgi:hypothetical protein
MNIDQKWFERCVEIVPGLAEIVMTPAQFQAFRLAQVRRAIAATLIAVWCRNVIRWHERQGA